MNTAVSPRMFLLAACFLMIAAGFAACDSGSDPGTGGGRGRLSDPGTAPTATPVESPLVFVFDGDRVLSPSGVSTVQPTQEAQTYLVESGDTCSAIASQFGLSVDELLEANPTIDSNCLNLAVGDRLRIPDTVPSGSETPTPSSDGGTTYTVVSGDVCSSIAAEFGVGVDALIAANGLDADCLDLAVGQELVIPAE